MPGADVRSILLDIEGTTTPITFVYEVLFPYVRANLRQLIERHARQPDYQRVFTSLHQDRDANLGAGIDVPPWLDRSPSEELASVARYSEWLMDRDSKTPPLKQLQGMIWEHGYSREVAAFPRCGAECRAH